MTDESSGPLTGAVYVIEDNADLRLGVAALLSSEGHDFRCYGSAEEFLHEIANLGEGIALIDLHLPGDDGHVIVKRLSIARPDIRCVMMTGDGDINAAIQALRCGAADFLEKPFDERELLSIVERELSSVRATDSGDRRRAIAKEAIAKLSRREFEVLELVARGKANKQVAHDLDLSVRTVHMHRARGMRRLGLRTVAELVRTFMNADYVLE
ncbi:response regulator transcription factor [Sphingomicrobium nitratireducens]|uniref:response regulator transcription factor n=1 Tax=Sphingomicrobium nitratireducens TaxID=2964666 RepID=UPI0022409A30|nr:response regulator [Sphingomicrobium nitratireducens]